MLVELEKFTNNKLTWNSCSNKDLTINYPRILDSILWY